MHVKAVQFAPVCGFQGVGWFGRSGYQVVDEGIGMGVQPDAGNVIAQFSADRRVKNDGLSSRQIDAQKRWELA